MKKLAITLALIMLAGTAWGEVIVNDDYSKWTSLPVLPSEVAAKRPSSAAPPTGIGATVESPFADWSTYGHKDIEVVATGGRVDNGPCLVQWVEDRNQPGGSANYIFTDGTHTELWFQYYYKYYVDFSWAGNESGEKYGRIKGSSFVMIPQVAAPTYKFTLWPTAGGVAWAANPNVLLSDYGNDAWICQEIHVKLNTVGSANGIIDEWLDGRHVLHKTGLTLITGTDTLSSHDFLDNIVNTLSDLHSPVEWPISVDDYLVSTAYQGPRLCPDGVELSPSGTGTCYCGSGSPDPDCADTEHTCTEDVWDAECIATNSAACDGLYDTGYCSYDESGNGTWSATAPASDIQTQCDLICPKEGL